MGKDKRIVVISKQRIFDDEKWRQLIIALTYALYEEQQKREAEEQQTQPEDDEAES